MTATEVWSSAALSDVTLPGNGETAVQFRDESDHTVVVHQDFFDWFAESAAPAQQKRARYCLRELLVLGACARRKNVKGAAKGWVRTQLGGTGGSHYYLWWAPYGYPAVDESELDPGQTLVRAVRHHDETSDPLSPGSRADWHVLDAGFVHDSADSELNERQREAAAPSGPPIRLVRGYPGSGKTTALLHAAAHVWGPKALFVTFSAGLALASREYLRTFAPQETAIDCLTFAELLAEFGDHAAQPTTNPSSLAIDRMREHLGPVTPQLGPWAMRFSELHAELHGHIVGRALPIAFRGLGASSGSTPDLDDYVAARTPAIGPVAAEKAAFAAGRLRDQGLLPQLFPELVEARSVLDRMAEALPSRLSTASVVFVDEVQDLTVVEAMVLLTTVARIGIESGTLPRLVIAGDEAQTVRPTAFGWNWFGDLVTSLLGDSHGKREEIALTSSMRSPRAVATVVEATRSHYRLLDKDARPAGMVYDSPEAQTEGRVFYCHASDEDWSAISSLFADHLSAQLVYPGDAIPPEYGDRLADVATAGQAKGLDFDLVGVLDAGTRQMELKDLADRADEDPLAGVLGRRLADQYRVAVSRSREDLLLLDGGPDSRIDAIRGLMEEADHDPVMSLEPADLGLVLQDDADEVDRLYSWFTDIDALLLDNPTLALVKARRSREFLLRVPAAVEVPAPLAHDVHRHAGLAAALASFLPATAPTERTALHAEASEAFGTIGLTEIYAKVDRLVSGLADTSPQDWPHEAVAAVASRMEMLRTELSPFESACETAMTRWVEAAAEVGLVLDKRLDEAIETLDLIVEAIPTRTDLPERRLAVMRATAAAANADDDPATELRCLEELDPAPLADVARCLESLKRWDEASRVHEELGDKHAQLRCVRQIPDFERAIALAEWIEPEIAARLRWAGHLAAMAEDDLTAHGPPLTEAEASALRDVLLAGLDAVCSATPAADALVVKRFGENAITEPEQTTTPERVTADEPTDEQPPTIVHELEPTPAPAPAESEPVLPPPPITETDADDSYYLATLCDEFGIDVTDGLALCRKLGISTVGSQHSMNQLQAQRFRRRFETHGLD